MRMLSTLFNKKTGHDHHEQPQHPEEAIRVPTRMPAPEGNLILLLYHGSDWEIWGDLVPHLETLKLRLARLLPSAFIWKTFYYPISPDGQPNEYEEFVSTLETALVFAPCTSPALVLRFWQHCGRDGRMMEALSRLYVQPIPLRAACGVRQSIIERPLAAYERGAARDAACVQIVTALEEKLLFALAPRGQAPVQAQVMIEETGILRALPAPMRREEAKERLPIS